MSFADDLESGATPGMDDVILADADMAAAALYVPNMADNKYSRGTVGLATGSNLYPGAAALSCRAAVRAGAGLVRYVGPERAQNIVLTALPEAVMGSGRVNAWVVGCGVPSEGNDEQRETIARLLELYAQTEEDANVHLAQDAHNTTDLPPIVVDAGALTALPARVSKEVVITPHAGELAHLLNRLQGSNLTDEDIFLDPFHYATLAHEITGATTLLKGGITVVAGKSGTYLVGNAPSWLATAGAGDVLAGIIGALIAQNAHTDEQIPLAQIVASGAYLHAMAASVASHSEQCALMDMQVESMTSEQQDAYVAAQGHPIIASDVIDAIPAAVEELLIGWCEYDVQHDQ